MTGTGIPALNDTPLHGEYRASQQGNRTALVACEQWLGSNGYAGFRALRRAGWMAHLVPEREFVPLRWRSATMRAAARLLRQLSVAEFNAELMRQAELQRPSFFLAFKGAFVTAATLRWMRSVGIRTYCFFPDVSFQVHGRHLPEALRSYDWIFITKSFGLGDLEQSLGVKSASLLLHGFDPEVHRPVHLTETEREVYQCDVSFIGTWSPKKEAILLALARQRPAVRLKVWGEQWESAKRHPELSAAIVGREAIGDEYVRAVIGSSINLAVLSERRPGASRGDQITSRTFHIPACGAFMLHERTSEVLAHFEDDVTIACFDDVCELLRQVDRYLPDAERRHAIAERARSLVWSRDSWDHLIRAILTHHNSQSAHS
jgi:spore maturation protein CgeB